jgi:sodium-dependent dicarboxylate transporter 2/3/5
MAELRSKPHTIRYYINSAIGIAFMIFFQFIPAPAPMTSVGMFVLGNLIGIIYLWTFVDMLWPTFVSIAIMGVRALEIWPSSMQTNGIYEAGMQSFGNWIALFALGCMILSLAIQESGLVKRITMWFLSRNIAKKSPYGFTVMFWIATFVIGSFMDCVAAQFFMLMIAHEIFETLGFKKGDAWPKYVVIGITFSIIISFAMTPISHTASLLFIGVYTGITGQPANFLSYMAVGIPIGIIIFVLMCLWFRFFVKIDYSKFENCDMDKIIDEQRPGRISVKERIVAVISIIVVVIWLIPGILSVVAPDSSLNVLLNNLTATFPLFIAITLLCIIHVDGKPILDIRAALPKIDWSSYLFLAAMLMVATAMGEDTAGIGAWVGANIVPALTGLTPYAVVTLLAVLGCIVTNVGNNIPVGIIFISAGVPMALQMGINPYLVVVAICIGANLAYMIPPAFVPVGVAYADPWCDGKAVLKNGTVMMIISCAVLAALMYPLGMLFI